MPESTEGWVQWLVDRAQITDLVSNYNHALDRHEEELFESLWALNATWHFVNGGGRFEGRQSILDAYRTFWDMHDVMEHCSSNVVVEVSNDGIHAKSRSKTLGRAITSSGHIHDSYIDYDDEYIKSDGEWKFLRREIRSHNPAEFITDVAVQLAG